MGESKKKYTNLLYVLNNQNVLENIDTKTFEQQMESTPINASLNNNDSAQTNRAHEHNQPAFDPEKFSDTSDFITMQSGIKDFINFLCKDLENNVSLDVLINKVKRSIDNTNENTFEFEKEFLDRIPADINNKEKVLILLLYFLHNTKFE